MTQALIPFEDISVKEFEFTDETGKPKSEVHLIITLPGVPDGDSDIVEPLNLIVRFKGPNMLGSFIEVLNFYHSSVFPDAEPLALDLTETEFKLRHLSDTDERQV